MCSVWLWQQNTNISLNKVKFWTSQSLDQRQSNSFYGVHQIRRSFPFQLKTEEEPAAETSYTVKNQDNEQSPKEEYSSLSRVQWAGIALSVWLLVTSWTVRGSNPGGGARFSAPVQTGPGAHLASCIMGTGSFPAVRWQERGVDNPPNLAPRLKKE